MKPNGKPESLDVLRCWAQGDDPYERWPEWGKVAWKLTERLAGRGLLDYGTSPRHCWMTPEGNAHLDRLRTSDL